MPKRTRDDLLNLIARAVRKHVTYMDDRGSRAIADTVLGDLRADGFAIRDTRLTAATASNDDWDFRQ